MLKLMGKEIFTILRSIMLIILNLYYLYILDQKRNAAYKSYIVYGGLSPMARKRFVTF